MLVKAIMAYLHYISIIGLVTALVVEWIVFARSLTVKQARLLQRADSLYGLTAILVLATGLLRAFIFEKGGEYYFGNTVFLIKLGLFTVVGLLSIYPTVIFIKWGKDLKAGNAIELDARKYQRIHIMIRVEVILVFLIPLFAALMARGYGFSG